MWLTKKYYNVTIIQWVLFILCVIILIVYLLCHFAAPHPEKYVSRNNNHLAWTTTEDILKNSEDGDILFLSGDTSGERTCRWFSGCIFSHVGFLFREKHPVTGENVVYIFDCDIGQGSKDGVRVQPLKDKLDRYKGFRIGALKKLNVGYGKTRPSYDDIMGLVKKYLPTEFDEYIATWWVARWPKIHRLVKNNKTMFCSELLANIYQDLGILKRDRVGSWYHPGDFMFNRVHLESGYSLSENQFFKFPKEETNKIIETSLPVETGFENVIIPFLNEK